MNPNNRKITGGSIPKLTNALYLVWGPPRGSRRKVFMAKHFGMDLKHVFFTTKQGKFHAPIRYFCQLIMTFFYLIRKRYEVIFVQAPPIFIALPVYFLSLFTSSKFVIDSHTPALIKKCWEFTLPLHRFLSRRAITTIVTNKYLKNIVLSWGANAFVLEDPPICANIDSRIQLEECNLNIAVICYPSPDEPIEEILQAARELEKVKFYITGHYTNRYKQLIDSSPQNVYFTGYLTNNYYPLLQAVDAILDLCVEDHQFLCGANEALWLSKPLITSKGTVLENYFCKGTVHVENTVDDIKRGIMVIQKERHNLKTEMLELQFIRIREWYEKARKLLHYIQKHTDILT